MAFTKIVSPGIDTTGSYTVQDLNVVGVVTASAFSGPLTGNATGLTGTPDITVGAITAASADFSGNVSIAGTLTYEDVTNIDSVGVITARDGLRVTGGDILLTGGDGRKISFAGDGSAHYFKMDNTLNGPIINGYGGIAFETNGANERLRINSAGNIGIASDTPAARLDVYKNFSGVSAGTYAGRVYGLDSGVNETGVRFVTKGTGDLHNASDAYLMHGISNGTTRFVFGANGSVGIGTDNPNNPLTVHGSGNHIFLKDTATDNNLQIRSSGGVAQFNSYGTAGARRDFVFNQYTTEVLRIASDGDVGIGTDNPTLRAHIYSTAATDAALIESNQNHATLRFKSAVNSSGPTIGIDGGGGLQFDQKDTSKYISFAIGSNGEKLRITSAGTLESYSPDDTTPNFKFRSDDTNWFGALNQSVHGATITTFLSCGGDWSANGTTYSATKALAAYPTSAIAIHNQYNNTWGSQFVFLTKAGGSTTTDGDVTERLRINSAGDVNIPGGILNLGTIGQHSAHINSPELMSFNIDTDNDDTNRYFIFRTNAATNSGTELMRLTEGGNLGIGGVDPATGDGGNSNYNNWDIPKLHVKGPSSSGKFHLVGRFHAGNDSDATGAQIVIHHENDRGMALQGGRSSGNKSYGAIKSLDNLARESNVMVFTGGTGQGVENIKFYTNGGSTGTNERLAINTYGTVHTGGSTEITQSVLSPDLITRAGVISPLFWRPFGGLTSAPSTSGPGYKDFGTGGVRHNLVDPHMGSGLGGSQFQGGLINGYGQTFSNTASGTTRESIEWNRFRLLFRGLCPSSGYSVSTVKFRYSTYHYSNGWQDHAGTEWTYTGTESERGARWVVGPWINPSSYFTNWADVPGLALYYNDNGSGRNFRIAGGVYYQYAYFQ